MISFILCLLITMSTASIPTRVLFIGNSFTFVNDLPHQIQNIAHSLGDEIIVANSTIGGCTVFAQRPAVDARTASLLQQDWDFIVLQSYSSLPTVEKARQSYLYPAIKNFVTFKKQAKIVMYLTWGYHDGNTAACPSSDNEKCFPLGSLAKLTSPSCLTSPHYNNLAGTFSCMGYALARGYIHALKQGADRVAPCGLAWQVVRNVTNIPQRCRELIDAQYPNEPFPLSLPLQINDAALPNLELYRIFAKTGIDKHPNVAGQYLNALTFYGTLFGKSPIGAAPPLNTGSTSAGDRPLTNVEIKTLQIAAHGVVEQCGSACGVSSSLSLATTAVATTHATSISTCTYEKDIDLGHSSTIVAYTKGKFNESECCMQCKNNPACAVASLLDSTHGSLEGCWLKDGEGTREHKTGVTTCFTGRAPMPKPKPSNLTLLNSNTNGKCMDGSPGGYYFAANTSSNSWIIELEGGGECASKKLCDTRKGTALFSSNYFKESLNFGAINTDDATNPKFRQFNRVFIPYCSQDLWTGQRVTATEETYGYYFAGHLILEAVLNELDTLSHLKKATNIILTGESAGGIGVWPNVDWLASRYPAARTVAAPIAGFYFFAYPYQGPKHTSSGLADFRKEAWPSHYKLWNSFVNKECALNMSPSYCILANNSFPFVTVESFIIEAQTDKVVLTAHDWVPLDQDPHWSSEIKSYFEAWSYNMSTALQPSMNVLSKNGVFNPACFIHTDFSATSPIINGKNYLQAFQAWYFKEEKAIKYQDDCGILCNPTCAH